MLTCFFFQKPWYWLQIIFHCRSSWAMQRVFLLSVPHSLTVMLIKPGMYRQEVLGNAKNEGLFFYPQILTFQSALEERRQISWVVTSLLLTLLLKQNSDFFFIFVFLLHFLSCSIVIVKYVVHSQDQGKSCCTSSPFADLPVR